MTSLWYRYEGTLVSLSAVNAVTKSDRLCRLSGEFVWEIDFHSNGGEITTIEYGEGPIDDSTIRDEEFEKISQVLLNPIDEVKLHVAAMQWGEEFERRAQREKSDENIFVDMIKGTHE